MFRDGNLRREEVLGQMVGTLGSFRTPGYWQIYRASQRGPVGAQEVEVRVDVMVITTAQMYKAIFEPEMVG